MTYKTTHQVNSILYQDTYPLYRLVQLVTLELSAIDLKSTF